MLKFILFKVAIHTLARLPLPIVYWLADLLGNLAYTLFPTQRRCVWQNLRHVMPPDTPRPRLRAAARQVFRNVALYYADLLRLPYTDPREFFERRLVVHGLEEHLVAAVKQGRGVIVLGAHCGNPELAAQGLIPVGIRLLALTEPLNPPRLSRLMDGLRSLHGHTAMPVSVSAVRRVMQTLKGGGVVALMGDRDIKGPRERLPFFGVETLLPTGPIEVGLRTGATIIPAFTVRRGYIIEADIQEPLQFERSGDFDADVRTGTLAFLERLERHLRADPGQWAVLEAIWDTPALPAKVPATTAGRSS